MAENGSGGPEMPALRRRAERRLKKMPPGAPSPETDADLARVVHELQVHQVELELQCEELRQAKQAVEATNEKYTDLYDFAPVGYFSLDRTGTVCRSNLAGAALLGVNRARLAGRRFALALQPEHRAVFSDFLDKTFEGKATESCEVALRTETAGELRVRLEARLSGAGQECLVAALDVTERSQAESALRKTNEELRQAMTLVQALQGILPICSGCKKIRDDRGCWHEVEVYVRDHSEAEFSHGLCPKCLTRLSPEFERDGWGRRRPKPASPAPSPEEPFAAKAAPTRARGGFVGAGLPAKGLVSRGGARLDAWSGSCKMPDRRPLSGRSNRWTRNPCPS